MKIDLKKLAEFLVEAKQNTYASEGKPKSMNGLKYFIWKSVPWYYKDTYKNIGPYSFEGKEIVKFNGKSIWEMNYKGSIIDKLYHDKLLSEKIYIFLRCALSEVEEDMPFRGPERFGDEPKEFECDEDGGPVYSPFTYENSVKGDIRKFCGKEKISDIKCIYRLQYSGGLIIPK
jgi:hypothetical protein